MSKAENLLTETFLTVTNQFSVIYNFREIYNLGFPTAKFHIYNQDLQFANELFNDSKYEEAWIDKQKAFDAFGGIEGLGYQMSQIKFNNFEASVDTASLIFAHSAIDNAVLNFCRCCALENPNDFEKFVENKQIPLKEIKGFSFAEILKKKVDDYIVLSDRESLLKKADKLFEICQPPKDFSPVGNYQYDKKRLENLDEMRHEVVHKLKSVPKLPAGDEAR